MFILEKVVVQPSSLRVVCKYHYLSEEVRQADVTDENHALGMLIIVCT